MKRVNIFKEVLIKDFFQQDKAFFTKYYDISQSQNFLFKFGPQVNQILSVLQPLRGKLSNKKALKIQKELGEILKENELKKVQTLMMLFRFDGIIKYKFNNAFSLVILNNWKNMLRHLVAKSRFEKIGDAENLIFISDFFADFTHLEDMEKSRSIDLFY